MLEFISDNKVIIIIIIVAIVLLLIAYFVGKSAAKNPSSINITPDIVGTDLSAEETDVLKGLAINLHNDMDGLNWSWDNALYNDVKLLSDSELGSLNNIFNTLYEVDSGESFVQWLSNENYFWNDYYLQATVDTIIQRLRGLGAS